MNVLFLSPGFPAEMPLFTRGLAQVGAKVFGVGDQPAAALPSEARQGLSDYLQVQSLADEPAAGEVHDDAILRIIFESFAMTEREIFLALLDLPNTATRSHYLDKVCSGEPAKRARLEALLLSHENAGSFLGNPALASQGERTATLTIGEQTPDEDSEEVDNDLKFLDKPSRADSLGRLGHYEILQVLGKGGFGIVFRAFDETLQRVVAIKVLNAQIAATSPARKRFLREARSSAKVRHEHVVQVYAVEEQPLPYLVMEFLRGESLAKRLKTYNERRAVLPFLTVLHIGFQVADALSVAHASGIVHRDLKPDNLMLVPDAVAPGGERVKILDFGIAKLTDQDLRNVRTATHTIMGTPMYMSPEQARGETLDSRSDLFSLGSVLYTMCAGQSPFRAEKTLGVLKRVCDDTPRPIREINPVIPETLVAVVNRLLVKDPNGRFQSAAAVAAVLHHDLGHAAAEALPLPTDGEAVAQAGGGDDITFQDFCK